MTAAEDWSWVEYAAREFDPPAPPEASWPTPGAMAVAVDPRTKQLPALEALDAAFVRVARGDVTKLMVFMPPQVGKSERAVRRGVEWLLAAFDPALRIVVASFDQDTARRWGKLIKTDVESYPELAITLRPDSKAAGQWNTIEGGGLYCVGVRGALSGRPVDILIIDDPIKDRAAAESEVQRSAVWDWWENVAAVRAMRTVLIQTRWHTDDLAGRLLEREPGEWEVLSVPAIAESDDDPLGRAVGEELTPARDRPPGYYSALAKKVSPYVWNSLYQQRPTAAQGGMFKRGNWQFWERGEDRRVVLDGHPHLLDHCMRFVTVDLAISKRTSADYTVAAAWAVTPTSDLVLLGRVRDRAPEHDHAALLAPLRQKWLWRQDTVWVEAAQHGTTLVYSLGRSGVPVGKLIADKDKLTRALPYAGLQRQRRVWLPRDAEWLDEWIDEHADFPNAAHDDQVDVGAYAARVLLTHYLPPEDDHIVHTRRVEEARQAQLPADEFTVPDVDFMSVSW